MKRNEISLLVFTLCWFYIFCALCAEFPFFSRSRDCVIFFPVFPGLNIREIEKSTQQTKSVKCRRKRSLFSNSIYAYIHMGLPIFCREQSISMSSLVQTGIATASFAILIVICCLVGGCLWQRKADRESSKMELTATSQVLWSIPTKKFMNAVFWSKSTEGEYFPLSSMHTVCVLCVFWAHASDFVTSRPFLMRLVWSAFE